MSGYVGAFGKVKSITAVGGSTEIVVILPVHYRPKYREYLHGKDVIVTLGEHPDGYGVYVAGVAIDETAEDVKKPQYGKYYQELFRYGWFNNPHACVHFGTDEDYQNFVRLQPSCVSNDFDEYVHGEGRSIYAHVRRASNSGTGIKPAYAGIPLTCNEHNLQHNHGESYFDGEDFFDKQAEKYRIKWIKSVIYKDLNVTSLAEISPSKFLRYATKKGFIETLPPKMKHDEGLFE